VDADIEEEEETPRKAAESEEGDAITDLLFKHSDATIAKIRPKTDEIF
jgi:hypothetical protein